MQQIFALMTRSLRVDARQRRWHFMRFILIAFMIWMIFFIQTANTGTSAPGLGFFWYIVMTNAVFITIGGPIVFGTSITEEKEERTLQLLKIANVGPLAILSGKVLPMLISAILVLSIQYPFTLLAVTLGGVTNTQIAAAFLSLLAYLFFVATLSTLCSVILRTSGGAISLSSILLGIYLFFPGVGWLLLSLVRFVAGNWNLFPGISRAITSLWDLSIFVRLGQIAASGFGEVYGETWYSTQVVANLIGGLVCFGLSWLVFDLCNAHLDDAVPTRQPLFKKVARKVTPQQKQPAPSGRCWSAALVWRDYVHLTGGHRTVVTKLLGYSLLIAIAMFIQFSVTSSFRSLTLENLGSYMFVMMIYILILEFAILVARTYRAEIKEKTLTTLMMLPKSTAQIAYGKLGGSLLTTLPAVSFLLLGMLFNPEIFTGYFDNLFDEPGIVILVTSLVVTHALLFLHLTAYFSILTNAWAGILIAGFIQWFGTMTVYATVGIMISKTISNPGEGLMYFVFFLAVAANIVIGALLHLGIAQKLVTKAAES